MSFLNCMNILGNHESFFNFVNIFERKKKLKNNLKKTRRNRKETENWKIQPKKWKSDIETNSRRKTEKNYPNEVVGREKERKHEKRDGPLQSKGCTISRHLVMVLEKLHICALS